MSPKYWFFTRCQLADEGPGTPNRDAGLRSYAGHTLPRAERSPAAKATT